MAEINEIQVGQDVFNIGGSGGGVNYSTQEQDTGLKWIDGKTIYQKTYIVTGLLLNNYIPFATDLTANYKIVEFTAVAISSEGAVLPMPFYEDSNTYMNFNKRRDGLGGGFVYYIKGFSNLLEIRFTVKYTKTT